MENTNNSLYNVRWSVNLYFVRYTIEEQTFATLEEVIAYIHKKKWWKHLPFVDWVCWCEY